MHYCTQQHHEKKNLSKIFVWSYKTPGSCVKSSNSGIKFNFDFSYMYKAEKTITNTQSDCMSLTIYFNSEDDQFSHAELTLCLFIERIQDHDLG